jgi:steroid delta-isomerase-like uncharacterized protein
MTAMACVLGLACSKEAVNAPPPAPIDWASLQARPAVDAGAEQATAKERALPDAYAAGVASKDFAQLASLLDENVYFESTATPPANGPQPVIKAHVLLFGAFDDRKLAVTRVWRTPEHQTVEWVMTGRQARDFMGVPATQKDVAFRGITLLLTRDDGTVKEIHVYFDTALVKARLGVGPKELLAVAGTPVVASADKPEVFETMQGGTSEEFQNVAVAKASLDALEHDEPGYLSHMADDVELHTQEHAEPLKGKDAVKGLYASMHKSIGQIDTQVRQAVGVGTYAIVEYKVDGEQLGPIDWIPAQPDRVITFAVVDVYEIQGGKIAKIWRYDDPAQIAAP